MKLENLKFNIDTKLVLNIGFPIDKTNAPIVYNKIFELHDMNALMLPVSIKKGELKSLFNACKTLGIQYLCPTMPHKADIIEFLDEVDENSRLFRSVNAVKFTEDGHSCGVGMDGKGAIQALLDIETKFQGATALMLGAGGISGSVGYELSQQGVKKLIIADFFEDKAIEKADIFNKNTSMKTIPINSSPKELDQAAAEADIFIQATPLGMAGFEISHKYLGFIDKLPMSCAVLDAIINPPETQVLKIARARNLKTVPGMRMLVGQIALIFDFLFGVKVTDDDKDACIKELNAFLTASNQ